MSKKVLIATKNQGKLREIKNILQPLNIKLLSLNDVGIEDEIEETGNSYLENAKIKAQFAAKSTNLITLAEDSGLEIEALNNEPGIKSARYIKGSDHDRLIYVLERLKGVPKEKRQACFRAEVVIYDPRDKKSYSFQGLSNGYITDKPKGDKGFGYDPIFFNSDLGKTNAQASQEEKNKVSHRARAFKEAAVKLKDIIGN